ncbi:MAG: hypothetical protein QXN55_09210 [Candidatus Nitrosotenuis sp.]
MRLSRLLFRINLGIATSLGISWLYFYWFTLTTDITDMIPAMTANYIIFGSNFLFASSLVSLPISFRYRK